MTEQLMIPLPGQPKRRITAKPVEDSAAKWSSYSAVHREKCNDCLLECGKDAHAPAARLAQRRIRGGKIDLLLCYEHATARGDTHDPKRRRRR